MPPDVPQCRMFRVPARGAAEPAGDVFPQIEELQEFVGGYVEHVRVTIAQYEMHLFMNEDGLRLGLPPNVVASALYAATFPPQSLRAALRRDPQVMNGLTIVGNVWLWHGPLPDSDDD
jgi:hypothetical protein